MGMKNIQKLMKQAQAMQEKLEGEMGELRIETSAGGGVVNITMDGTKQLPIVVFSNYPFSSNGYSSNRNFALLFCFTGFFQC